MKSNSQDNVRTQFNLPPNEKIYDDFGCSLSKVISYHGRLYLTENNLCFHSNIINEIKIIIPFFEIKELLHTKDKIFILTTNNAQPKVTFVSFSNLSVTYKRIKMICRAYLKKITIQSNGKASLNNSVISCSRSSLNMSAMSIHKNNNDSIMILSDSDDQSDDQEEENMNDAVFQQDHNIEERKNSQLSIESQKKIDTNDVEEVIFPKLEDAWHQVCKVVINKSPMEFFDKYLKSQPDTSYSAFYASIDDYSDVVIVSDWERKEDPTKECYERKWSFTIKLINVPFYDHSDVTKTQVYSIDHAKNLIVMKGSSASHGVSYCDSFTVEDIIELFPYLNNTKCILRASVMNNFIKSVWGIQSMISQSSKKEYQKEMDRWIDFIRKCGDTVEDYVPQPFIKKRSLSLTKNPELKLLHGVENTSNIANQKRRIRMSESLKNLVVYGLLALLIIAVIIILVNQRNHSHLLMEQNAMLSQLLQQYHRSSCSNDFFQGGI